MTLFFSVLLVFSLFCFFSYLLSNISFSFKVYYSFSPHTHLLVVHLLTHLLLVRTWSHDQTFGHSFGAFVPSSVSQIMCTTWTLPLPKILILQYIKTEIQIFHFMYNSLIHSQKYSTRSALYVHPHLETPIPPNTTITHWLPSLFLPPFLSLTHMHTNYTHSPNVNRILMAFLLLPLREKNNLIYATLILFSLHPQLFFFFF